MKQRLKNILYSIKKIKFSRVFVVICMLLAVVGLFRLTFNSSDSVGSKESLTVEQSNSIESVFNNGYVRYSYSELLERIKQKEIDSLTLRDSNNIWYVSGNDKKGNFFISSAPIGDTFSNYLIEHNINTEFVSSDTQNKSSFLKYIFNIFIVLIIITVIFSFFNRKNGNLTQNLQNKNSAMLKSKAKLHESTSNKVLFSDVAGNDEEKEELREIVDFLKNKNDYVRVGARIPKGVLLVGPPGTGKTLLARAVAGESGVPFFSISGSDFVEMYVGVGAARVRQMFEEAKQKAPCIIFIDEIDAVGRKRSSGFNGNSEQENTLNQLLVEMDGFNTDTGIIMIGATNRVDILDNALLRSGRFDRQVFIGLPDVIGREEILKVHSRNKKLAEDVDFKLISERTIGFSGADLENLLNEAAISSVRKKKDKIYMEEIEMSVDKIMAGTQKANKKISKKEKKLIAYHESGHVIMGHYLGTQDVHKVTIVPRGQAGGYAIMIPKEENMTVTKQELKDRIAGLLGGRASEEFFLGEVSTGASNDFMKATELARKMVTEYGMSDLGIVQFSNDGNIQYSSETRYKIEVEINNIINEQYNLCLEYMEKYRDKIEALVNHLLKVETLNRDEILEILNNSINDTTNKFIEQVKNRVAENIDFGNNSISDSLDTVHYNNEDLELNHNKNIKY